MLCIASYNVKLLFDLYILYFFYDDLN